MNARPIEVTCPTCEGKSVYAPSNPHRPFCSERCRNIDLGAWASERYRVGDPEGGTQETVPPGRLPQDE